MAYLPLTELSARDSYLGPGSGETLLLALAPIMFGLVWNWFLLGTLMVQVYYYHITFPRDHRGLKTLVYGVFILDIMQTALTTHTSYHTFVEYFSNPKVLNDPARTIVSLPLFDGIIAAVVQAFYAWRIWQLGKALIAKAALVIILTIIALASTLQTLAAMVTAFTYVRFQRHPLIPLPMVTTTFAIWLSSGMAVDSIIAFAMSYLIFKAKDTKALLHGDTLLNKILIRVVATGVLTAFCAMINLVLFVRFHKTDLYETPAYLLGKLFSNALLVNLNIRSRNEKGRVVDLDTSPKRVDLSVTANSLAFASPSHLEQSGGRVTSTHDSTSVWPPRTESTDVQTFAQINLPEDSSHSIDSTSGDRVNTVQPRDISRAKGVIEV